jgi:hypothetical protein
MPQSTPLENIENNEIPDNQASDEERVQRIIREMNSSDDQLPGAGEPQAVPSMGGPMGQMNMMGPPPPQATMLPRRGGNGMEMMHPSQMMYQPQVPVEAEPVAAPSKKNVWAHISDAFKLPVVVAVVFFVLSLPVFDVYLSKYAHWAFSAGGHLSMAGLALKAVAAGAIMGVYDTIDKVISRFF